MMRLVEAAGIEPAAESRKCLTEQGKPGEGVWRPRGARGCWARGFAPGRGTRRSPPELSRSVGADKGRPLATILRPEFFPMRDGL